MIVNRCAKLETTNEEKVYPWGLTFWIDSYGNLPGFFFESYLLPKAQDDFPTSITETTNLQMFPVDVRCIWQPRLIWPTLSTAIWSCPVPRSGYCWQNHLIFKFVVWCSKTVQSCEFVWELRCIGFVFRATQQVLHGAYQKKWKSDFKSATFIRLKYTEPSQFFLVYWTPCHNLSAAQLRSLHEKTTIAMGAKLIHYSFGTRILV